MGDDSLATTFTRPRASLSRTPGAALVLADLARMRAKGQSYPQVEGVFFAQLCDLNRALLDEVCPQVVLSPLFAVKFDASEIAQRLAALNYRGTYRVFTLPLPDPDMVRRELCGLAPEVDIDLLVIGGP